MSDTKKTDDATEGAKTDETAPKDAPKALTREDLEKPPEDMTRDELVATIRRAELAESIDLRMSGPKLLAALLELAPQLAPPPPPEEVKKAADLEELAKRAEEGDDDAAAALKEISEVEAAEQRGALMLQKQLEDAAPALDWLAGFGFKADPRDMKREALLEALLAIAAYPEEPPSSAIALAAASYLGIAMELVGAENREIVNDHRRAVVRALEENRKQAKNAAPRVRFYRVERTARYVRDSVVYTLHAGATVSSAEYPIEELRKQGVPLIEIAAPRAGG